MTERSNEIKILFKIIFFTFLALLKAYVAAFRNFVESFMSTDKSKTFVGRK